MTKYLPDYEDTLSSYRELLFGQLNHGGPECKAVCSMRFRPPNAEPADVREALLEICAELGLPEYGRALRRDDFHELPADEAIASLEKMFKGCFHQSAAFDHRIVTTQFLSRFAEPRTYYTTVHRPGTECRALFDNSWEESIFIVTAFAFAFVGVGDED